MEPMSAATARRVALAAQGFADPRPKGKVGVRHIRRVVDRVKLLQLDSVNVLVRSHYLPVFSRLGPYPMALLDEMAGRRRMLFEYWGHAASLLPMELQPLLRWRMEETQAKYGHRAEARERERPGYYSAVYEQVKARGPLSVADLEDPGEKRRGNWWGWGDGKMALEWLFMTGRITTGERRNFERRYDIPERVFPPEILDAPTPPVEEATRQLLALSAEALGVGTQRDLFDYFRLRGAVARAALRDLVDSGDLVPVAVEGWDQRAYVHAAAKTPRRIDAAALLSPFDPIVWERSRAQRLFGFSYTIEIYVPAPKRRFGYYVLPFLRGEHLVARVDLKSDRAAGRLLLKGAYVEPGHDPVETADALHEQLVSMAGWLGLEPPSRREVRWSPHP